MAKQRSEREREARASSRVRSPKKRAAGTSRKLSNRSLRCSARRLALPFRWMARFSTSWPSGAWAPMAASRNASATRCVTPCWPPPPALPPPARLHMSSIWDDAN